MEAGAVPGGAQANAILLLSVGNTLMRDDGVGRRLLDVFQERRALPRGATILDGGTLSYSLATYLEEADGLLVFDAAHMGAAPGTVGCFEGSALDELLWRPGRSVHEVGLADVMDMVRLLGRLPARRALVAVEPATVSWGDELSPAVAAALPAALEVAQGVLERWGCYAELPA